MTDLKKTIARVSGARVHEQSKEREIVIILEPPSQIGFRLKGTRKTYWLKAESCYYMAVKAEVAARAKEQKRARKR